MTRARETSENARLAKAWVNFNGAFGTSPFTEANGGIRSAFNVSSVTDLGTGHYDINFEDSFSNTNYSVAGSCGRTNSTGSFSNPTCVRPGQLTNTKIRVSVNYTSGSSIALFDFELINIIIFGD